MQAIEHTITAPPGRMQRRISGLIFAGLLQVGVVWVLVSGVADKYIPIKEHHTQISIIRDHTKDDGPPPQPVNPTLHDPNQVVIGPPTFQIDDGQPHGGGITTIIQPGGGGGAGDTGPVGLMATHTIPPYPPLAIHLGEQGSVQLRLVIGADGVVTDAVVVRSSGFRDLDEAARAWVIGRWRYHPAMRGGAAVPSAATAVVRFDLKNAG